MNESLEQGGKNTSKICPYSYFSSDAKNIIFWRSVNGSIGDYIVIHHINATSPPDDGNFEQYYIHYHQIDHNLVIDSSRKLTLINPEQDEQHHMIFLIE